MCYVAAAIAVVSAVATAYAQKKQGEATEKAAEYNSKMQDYNASLSEGRAADAIDRGDIAASQIKQETSQIAGEGRAGFAAGGVDLSSGSVKYWELDTAAAGATDAAMTRYGARQEAAGLSAEAWNARASSRLSRFQGRSARQAGNIGAGTSLLAGAAQVAYGFSNYQAAKKG